MDAQGSCHESEGDDISFLIAERGDGVKVLLMNDDFSINLHWLVKISIETM